MRLPCRSWPSLRGNARSSVRRGCRSLGVLTLGVVTLGTVASGLVAQQADTLSSNISGRVFDRESQQPVADAFVELGGTNHGALTNAEGVFRIRSVLGGSYALVVSHIAYGAHQQDLVVPQGGDIAIRVSLTSEAIELDALVVEAESERDRRNRARGIRVNELTADEIERYMATSRNLADVLQQAIPSLRSVPASIANGRNCIEFRSPGSVQGVQRCRSPLTFLDGVRMWDPPMLYGALDLNSISRIELIPPAEAGAEYGSDSSFGVLLIETKTYRSERIRTGQADDPLSSHLLDSTWNWEHEDGDHSSARVFLFSALGNAAGLAAGLGIARECVDFNDLASDFFNSSCGSWGSAGARGAAILGPALGSALAARYAGATSNSRGRFWPAFAAAGVATLPGYAIASSSTVDGFEGTAWVSKVFLLIASPAVTTLADHMYRRFTGS